MTDPVKIIVGEGDITEVNVPDYNLIQTGGGGGSGSDGATFFPEVSEEGVISWTNDGGYDNPEPVNIKGPAGNDGNDGNDGEDGEDGVSPTVTFTTITGGHTMTVTDKDHPSGQSINIMDGSGGSGTSDYDDLTDKPSINNVTLSGNKTAAQLGLGTYSKPSSGIPQTDLASTVQTSLGLADTALQSVPSTYRTAAAQDTIDAGFAKTNEVGIIINGKRPSRTVTAGQYVIVRNSTISGISDGLYIAKSALSTSTDVTAANLVDVGNGGLNSLQQSKMDKVVLTEGAIWNFYSCYGYTDNGKTITLTIPVTTQVAVTTPIVLTRCQGSLRSSSGSVVGGFSFNYLPYVTTSDLYSSGRGINIILNKSDGFGITGMSIVCGFISLSFQNDLGS